MKTFYKILVISFLIVSPLVITPVIYGQSKARVENVNFFLEDEAIIITYDITKAKMSEVFTVSVNISTSNGKQINAYALSGDIGDGIYPGKGKRIKWDIMQDNVYLDDEIVVEVFARSPLEARPVSVGGALARSLIFPGWGNRYAKGGGAYWLMGVMAYGAAGGALYFNNEAYNTYEDYKIATNPDDRNQLFEDAENHEGMQNNLIIAAAAIWAIDLVWTGIQAGNVNRKAARSKLSAGAWYDPYARQPMFKIAYNLN
jgi:hypothetical protein